MSVPKHVGIVLHRPDDPHVLTTEPLGILPSEQMRSALVPSGYLPLVSATLYNNRPFCTSREGIGLHTTIKKNETNVNNRITGTSFKQQLALKYEHVVEFLLFSCKRLCTMAYKQQLTFKIQ